MGWVNKKLGIKKYSEGSEVSITKKKASETINNVLSVTNPVDLLFIAATHSAKKTKPKKKKKKTKSIGGTYKHPLIK